MWEQALQVSHLWWHGWTLSSDLSLQSPGVQCCRHNTGKRRQGLQKGGDRKEWGQGECQGRGVGRTTG